VGFTSIEAVRNFPTRERLALLHATRTRRPESLYELAKLVGRDFKNVQEDIRLVERHGLGRIAKQPRRAPEACADLIHHSEREQARQKGRGVEKDEGLE
jgi:predicted transcriptional regulator